MFFFWIVILFLYQIGYRSVKISIFADNNLSC